MKPERKAILKRSLWISSQEIAHLIDSINYYDINFLVEKILKTSSVGNILLSGVGTSGVAAHKIVHSLRCQNLPAFFLSPGDALHGASGVIQPNDLYIVISNGGTSDTVNKSAKIAKEREAFVIAITGDCESELCRIADAKVLVKVEKESDYMGLLATSSILCVIALFDAVSSVIMSERHFTKEMFSHIHPEGKVGQVILKKHIEEL